MEKLLTHKELNLTQKQMEKAQDIWWIYKEKIFNVDDIPNFEQIYKKLLKQIPENQYFNFLKFNNGSITIYNFENANKLQKTELINKIVYYLDLDRWGNYFNKMVDKYKKYYTIKGHYGTINVKDIKDTKELKKMLFYVQELYFNEMYLYSY